MDSTPILRHYRAIYTNVEPHEARAKGYDVVMLKYDGIWCRAVGMKDLNQIRLFSREGALKRVIDAELPTDFELIGELMHGTQWAHEYGLLGNFYAFDLYRYGQQDTTDWPFIERLLKAVELTEQLPANFKRVVAGDISELDQMRTRFVDDSGEYGGAFEGLVFAHSHKPNLQFGRWKKTYTLDCTIIGVKEGQGRLAGSLGALVVLTPNGQEMLVGGGFDDRLRNLLWVNQTALLGMVVEVEGKAIFTSGVLRHPVFVRFHPDKNNTKPEWLPRHSI